MLILGIDPGTARLGIGLVESTATVGKAPTVKFVHAVCLETKMETPAGERLLYLGEELSKIVEKYHPDVACVEQLFFGINARTAIAVGQARGVILATLAKYKVSQIDYQGLSVKFALTGFGRSDKKQIQESVRQHLKMKDIIKSDDAADGLAIAITHHIKINGIKVKPPSKENLASQAEKKAKKAARLLKK